MFNIGPQELLLILLVALVVVGPKRLPELSRTIGRGLREFRKAQDEVKKTITLGLDEPVDTPTSRVSTPTVAPTPDTAAAPAPDAVPAQAATSPEPDDVADVARTLGRGLAEIRRTREEIQRTFRVDLNDRPAPRRPAASPSPSPAPTSAEPSTAAEAEASTSEAPPETPAPEPKAPASE